MLVNSNNPLELYTFGANQLSKHINTQNKSKFPFRKMKKPKKISINSGLFSQQRLQNTKRQKTYKQAKNNKLKQKILQCLDSQPKNSVQNRQNQNSFSNIKYHSCQKKKTSLPKIFQVRSNSNKKRIISSEKNFRYQHQNQQNSIQQFQVEFDDKLLGNLNIKQKKRPSTMMYLSQQLDYPLMMQKHKTITQRKSIRGSKYQGSIQSVQVKGIDDKILQNISELKKIYKY